MRDARPVFKLMFWAAIIFALSVAVFETRPAHAATRPNTVHWVAPTQWTDGSDLPAASINGFNLYCGTSAGVYDVVIVVPGNSYKGDCPTSSRFAVVTTLAALPDDPTDIRESDYSNETRLMRPRAPLLKYGN